MLIEIYILLFTTATLFTVLSFTAYALGWSTQIGGFLRINIVLPFIAALMFLVLSLGSSHIQYQHCDTPVDNIESGPNADQYDYNVTDNDNQTVTGADVRFEYPFSCTTYTIEQTVMIRLNQALGLIMFLFGIFNIIEWLELSAREIDRGLGRDAI